MSPRPAMPRLLVLAIAVAIAAAIVVLVVALFVLGAAVRRVDCSPALEPPAALVLSSPLPPSPLSAPLPRPPGPRPPAVDVKSLHAKIGELTLENDFLEGALNKAGLLSAKR